MLPKQITATDLKSNLGKYLDLADKQCFTITKNGKEVATLSPPQEKPSITSQLIGAGGPDNGMTIKKARYERIMKRHYESLD